MTAARDLKRLHSIHPGDWYFGTEYKRLHTVLGSCVALTAWHPKFKVGGLCHYLLASLPDSRGVARDCRYAVNALEQMRLAMLAFGRSHDFELGYLAAAICLHLPRQHLSAQTISNLHENG